MKTLIIYKSYHRMNTEKIAKVMAEVLNAKLTKVEDARPEEIPGYDLIGFGSGIYGYKHHKSLFALIETLPLAGKKVFVFSTSGNFRERHHLPIKEKLAEKGCTIVGEFSCFGEYSPLGFNLNLNGPLALIAGKNKGHPDGKDLENARVFAKGLLSA